MSLFNIEILENIKNQNLKKEYIDNLKNNLVSKENIQETKNSLLLKKCHLNTLLKYDVSLEFIDNKIKVKAELYDTLILTVLVILSILFTYGVGVILIIVFTYFQKRKASKYLKTNILME